MESLDILENYDKNGWVKIDAENITKLKEKYKKLKYLNGNQKKITSLNEDEIIAHQFFIVDNLADSVNDLAS